MPVMKEKRFSIAGFEVGIAADAARAERIRKSLMFRYLVRPGLKLVSRNGHGRVDGLKLPGAPNPSPPRSVRESEEAREIWERVSRIKWYHTIDLGNGIVTPGFIDNRPTAHLFGLPDDLSGKRCLDIGTYDGFWSFEMERRGAAEVVAIDVESPADYDVPRLKKKKLLEEAAEGKDIHGGWNELATGVGLQFPGDGFRLAKEILKSKAERKILNVYDLSPEKVGTFDVVLISQLLLRLRDPQTVIENMFSVCRGFAVVAEGYAPELEGFSKPVSAFIGTTALGVWWEHSTASMQAMMKIAGFDPVEKVATFVAENRSGRFHKVILKGHVPGAAAN
ncbi:MAG: class I SAM-dependent methyltransferase [Dehalococcoidia bacterium]|nr:class I SAM-dependent methyltransferase [Dehalococcoidia bacterium]